MQSNRDGYFADAEASEDLKNRSICVKVRRTIRNVKNEKISISPN